MTFTVHEPPQPAADRVDRADELRFIKDGFSWLTALVPPLGLAAKGLWFGLAAYFAAALAMAVVLPAFGADNNWVAVAISALGLFLGFEISTIERFMLDRAGWRMVGTVTGRNLAECERRFFESWLPEQPVIAVKPATAQTHLGLGARA